MFVFLGDAGHPLIREDTKESSFLGFLTSFDERKSNYSSLTVRCAVFKVVCSEPGHYQYYFYILLYTRLFK